MTKKVFLDTEATTLLKAPRVLWEVAAIVRETGVSLAPSGDREYRWQLRPDMLGADERSLEISGFHERFMLPDGVDAAQVVDTTDGQGLLSALSHSDALAEIAGVLDGAHIYGVVPSFDTARLELDLSLTRPALEIYVPPWHYQLHDAEDLVMGYIRGRLVETGLRQPRVDATRWTSAEGFPYDSLALSKACGVTPPTEAHTALGDARWVRDLHDAVMQP